MTIQINGEKQDLAAPVALAEVIQRVCRDPGRVVAELNGQIIKRQAWPQTDVQDGDTLELVSFVGGG